MLNQFAVGAAGFGPDEVFGGDGVVVGDFDGGGVVAERKAGGVAVHAFEAMGLHGGEDVGFEAAGGFVGLLLAARVALPRSVTIRLRCVSE